MKKVKQDNQLPLFGIPDVVKELQAVEIDRLTPLDALVLLQTLKKNAF
jgi:hypothetical protein